MFDSKKLMDAMKQAMEMQQKMQQELASKSVEGSSLGGMVVVNMNGEFQVAKVSIDPQLIAENDLEFVQEMIRAAFNDAVVKTRELVGDQVKSVTSKLGL